MEKDFIKQVYSAERIKNLKLKEWYTKFKEYVPEYVTDYLFHKKGKVSEMIEIDEEVGFVFDPATLEAGIDMLVRVIDATNHGDFSRAQAIYQKFENFIIRVDYLRQIIEQLDVYRSIGELVIADLEKYAQENASAEIAEIVESQKRNIRARAKTEQKESQNRSRQPQ